MAAARAGAQRRARPRRHRATAAEEQVLHSGTGTVGASRRPRLRRLRHSASACAPGRGGLRAVPLRGGRRGPASLPGVCLSFLSAGPGCSRLTGWRRGPLRRDVGRLAWQSRLPATQWSCTRPGVVSNPPSRPASLPLHRRIDGPEQVISVVLDIQAPVFKLSLLRRPALLGLFAGVPNQSSPHTFWDREQGTERTNIQ